MQRTPMHAMRFGGAQSAKQPINAFHTTQLRPSNTSPTSVTRIAYQVHIPGSESRKPPLARNLMSAACRVQHKASK